MAIIYSRQGIIISTAALLGSLESLQDCLARYKEKGALIDRVQFGPIVEEDRINSVTANVYYPEVSQLTAFHVPKYKKINTVLRCHSTSYDFAVGIVTDFAVNSGIKPAEVPDNFRDDMEASNIRMQQFFESLPGLTLQEKIMSFSEVLRTNRLAEFLGDKGENNEYYPDFKTRLFF